jgi:hypothetical protein
MVQGIAIPEVMTPGFYPPDILRWILQTRHGGNGRNPKEDSAGFALGDGFGSPSTKV